MLWTLLQRLHHPILVKENIAMWAKNKQAIVDKIKKAKRAEDLFIGIGTNKEAQDRHLKRVYQGMAKVVHPDTNPKVDEANLVLAALNVLHEEALMKVADGTFGKRDATFSKHHP